jgi:hypothetical protein
MDAKAGIESMKPRPILLAERMREQRFRRLFGWRLKNI